MLWGQGFTECYHTRPSQAFLSSVVIAPPSFNLSVSLSLSPPPPSISLSLSLSLRANVVTS